MLSCGVLGLLEVSVSAILCHGSLRRALALLDGAISGLVVLLEISPSTFAGRRPYLMALYRDLSYFS